MRNIGWTLMYSSIISLVFSVVLKTHPLAGMKLQMIPTSFASVPVYLSFMVFSIMHWGENKLDFILNKEVVTLPNNIKLKSTYFILMCIIGIGGSITEIGRREWMLWIVSFATINVAGLLFWKICNHRYHLREMLEVPMENMFLDTKNIFIEALLHAVVFASLAIGLLNYLTSK